MNGRGGWRRRLLTAALVLGVVGGFGAEFVRIHHHACAVSAGSGTHGATCTDCAHGPHARGAARGRP